MGKLHRGVFRTQIDYERLFAIAGVVALEVIKAEISEITGVFGARGRLVSVEAGVNQVLFLCRIF